jgi:DNA-binding MarR family transcriptional regulator
MTILFARLLQGDYLSRIAQTGIAPAQAFVLRELWQEEPLTQVELSRRLDIGKATVGQTLIRLERAGLIERRRVRSDRRVMMIYLTEKGHAVREPLATAACAQVELLGAALGRQNLERLEDLLERAVAHLRRSAVASDDID